MKGAGAAAAIGMLNPGSIFPESISNIKRGEDELTSFKSITNYNNFYEFSTD